MNNFLDNFIKGPLTSLLGFAIMIASAYGWWVEYLTDWQGGGFGLVGFALLWMRDKLPDFVTQFIKLIFDKFRGGPPAAPTVILLLLISTFSFGQTVVSDTVMGGNNYTNILNKVYKPSRMYNMIQQIINSKLNINDTLQAHFYINGGTNSADADNGYQIHFGEGKPVLEFGAFAGDETSNSYFYVFPSQLFYQNPADGSVDFNVKGQIIRDGAGTLDASAILELQSTDKALLLTRLASDGAIATPVNGMVYYNTTTNKVRIYQNSIWQDANGTNTFALTLQGTSLSPADATTYYFGIHPNTPTTSTTIRKIIPKVSCTLKSAWIYSQSTTAGSAEAWEIFVRKNNTTDTSVQSITSSSGEREWVNTGLNISMNGTTDYIEMKMVCPTWATNPVGTVLSGILIFEIN